MTTFIIRRLVAAFFILLGASFIVYMLMANAGDPLAFTLEITNPTHPATAIRASVTEALNLDVHPVARYFMWLGDCVRSGDFGISARTQQPVIDDLGGRMLMTLKLVMAATVLSIVDRHRRSGIVTALRQYSGFDYITTFFTFVFFSLPVFWVAVILKAVGWHQLQRLAARRRPLPAVVHRVVAVLVAGLVGYSRRRRAARPRRLTIGVIGGAHRDRDARLHLGRPVAARSRVRADRDRAVRARASPTASRR